MSELSARSDDTAVVAAQPPPRHVAIIMDGNGRWARARGLPRSAGHREGVEALRRVVDACPEFGIEHLTVYSFSTENWSRPQSEIDDLLELLRQFVSRDLDKLHAEGVCIRVLGSREGLAPDIVELIEKSTALTRHNDRFVLNIAFNYGGRAEIVAAVRELLEEAAAGELEPASVSERVLSDRLWSARSPDPDLIIRTSGEVRLSNFLLWSSAYAELVFPEVWWPDFDREHLEKAVLTYQSRVRRFGGSEA